jgi:hypothetical protein
LFLLSGGSESNGFEEDVILFGGGPLLTLLGELIIQMSSRLAPALVLRGLIRCLLHEGIRVWIFRGAFGYAAAAYDLVDATVVYIGKAFPDIRGRRVCSGGGLQRPPTAVASAQLCHGKG